MIIDGLTLVQGSSIDLLQLNTDKTGVTFPVDPNEGDEWQLTEETDTYVEGRYLFSEGSWRLVLPGNSPIAYDINGTIFDTVPPSTKVLFFVSPRSFTLARSFIGCIAKAEIEASSEVTFNIEVKRSDLSYTQIGTMTFNPGNLDGVFVAVNSTPINVNRGDIISITSPSFEDQTLQNVSFTLSGYITL